MLAAKTSFMDGERHCRITNRRLDWYYVQRERLAPDLDSHLIKMEKWISEVLGPFDQFHEQIPELVRVTPGATATSSRRNSLPHMKLRRSYECPTLAGHYLRSLAALWGYPLPRIIPKSVNRVEVVPKNWKTYRTIACEPTGALPFQLAFDSYGKTRLARKGINLRDQSLNQRLAYEASVTSDKIVTIDLQNASNTVSFNTVAWLLPEPWFRYLAGLRSSSYTGPFGSGNYAMFSSMGNGGTFVLETLIFAAACHAVGSKVRAVYGDDIVISTDVLAPFLRLMRFLGFIVNHEKSHFSGPYHESCGEHWFNGIDITPSFVRKEHFATKSGMAHLVNTISAVSLPGGTLWKYLLNLVRVEQLPLVPYNTRSDSGVYIEPSDAVSLGLLTTKRKKTFQIAVYRAFVPKGKKVCVTDSRALFLWYLAALKRGLKPFSEPLVSSGVTSSSHRYVRKWVCWIPPARPLPYHLSWWSGDVLAALELSRRP
jgi:hypothetical protein